MDLKEIVQEASQLMVKSGFFHKGVVMLILACRELSHRPKMY